MKRRKIMNNEQLNEHLESIKYELDYAEKKHPKFCNCFDSLIGSIGDEKVIKTNLAYIRSFNDSLTDTNSIGAMNILQEELLEAMEAFAEGDLRHCLQELAQCGAVILRTMDFVSRRIQNDL